MLWNSFLVNRTSIFINMVKSLCNGYEIPCSITLSTSLLDAELAHIIVDQHQILENEKKFNARYII